MKGEMQMANQEHLKIMRRGIKTWNTWRKKNSDVVPELKDADLSGMKLPKIDLSKAVLCGATMRHTDLSRANLVGADLSYTTVQFSFFEGADLRRAVARGAHISASFLNDADLRHANLEDAILDLTMFKGTRLNSANLTAVVLRGVFLRGADLNAAVLYRTVFDDVYLGDTRGVAECRHQGPSTLDMSTIAQSWPLPSGFLRGVGLSEGYIEQLPTLLSQAREFRSCFISYSSKDHKFVEQLYKSLQDSGVRCWYAPENLKAGTRFPEEIAQAIRSKDRLLVVLSDASLESDWVEQEVSIALSEERAGKVGMLLPIRVDDTVMRLERGWARDLGKERHIVDFSKWKNSNSYLASLKRLLRDLEAPPASMEEISQTAHESVRDKFVWAWANECDQAIEAGELEKAEELVQSIATHHELTDDESALERTAQMMCNFFLIARQTAGRKQAERCLKSLEATAKKYPGNAIVDESLARCYGEAYNDAEESKDRTAANRFLSKMRSLHSGDRKNAQWRSGLSFILRNRCSYRQCDGDVDEMDAILDRLRKLGSEDHDDEETILNLAEALFLRLLAAEEACSFDAADQVLDEMRRLAAEYPDNHSIVFEFAKGLCNRILDTNEYWQGRLGVVLRKELMALARAYPDIDRKLRSDGWTPPYGMRL
ncbi:MAG: toll/interleukin-1 receptor domain-containing protein [Candidatus Hydrogenedentota bacterium]|nr:MAG: toll/interleukin-1 receptor domain-containing protein [Candidatus Hydrogenedentota bacterium]